MTARREHRTTSAGARDPLTGLERRDALLARVTRALDRARPGRRVAVLVLELDDFHLINDSLGHAVGDVVLIALAGRLSAAVRPGDAVARISGDEFAVVCEAARTPAHAVKLARRLLAVVREPFQLPTGRHVVDASAGVALAEHGDAELLLRNANAAAHRAKRRRSGMPELYGDDMRRTALTRLRDEADLRAALERDELRVHYQPIVDLATCAPRGLEALVRWQHPERGLLAPGAFVPLAEDTGLIEQLGEHVLVHACRQVAAWQRRFKAPLELALNVSVRELADPRYARRAASIARGARLLPHTLTLEVTESILLDAVPAPESAAERLTAFGLRLALDDFGTGYSSLSNLKRLPVDTLKIDRSFVHGLGIDADAAALVDAILRMARALRLRAVAEGVEREQQRRALLGLGCSLAQGHLFAPALPPATLQQWLAARLHPGEIATPPIAATEIPR